MTSPIADNLIMPSEIALVQQTIESYGVDHSKSALVTIASGTLLTIGLMLVDAAKTVEDARAALYEAEGDDVCSRSAFYNFAADFRGRFDAIRKTHRHRIARMTVTDNTGTDIKSHAMLIKARLTELAAEKAIDADTLENLTGGDMDRMIRLVGVLDAGDAKLRELQLKAEDAQRRQAKLEADLAEAQLKRDRLQQQIDEAQSKFDEAIAAKQSTRKGSQMTDEDIAEIRRAVFGR